MHSKNQRLVTRAVAVVVGALLLTTLAVATNSSSLVFAASTPQPTTHVSALLYHTPEGLSRLTWDARTNNLTIQISLYGLVPYSTHPAHLHAGDDCTRSGDVIATLNNVVANGAGIAVSTTVLPGVEGGIPEHDWYINVHNGPDMSDDQQAMAIACATIKNSQHSNAILAHMHSTIAPNQAAYGIATLDIIEGNLVVKVNMSGLAPYSTHQLEIHAGSCQQQTYGKTVYDLALLEAGENGKATSETTIEGVTSIPNHPWYIAVHYDGDLSTQTNADVIACANVNA